MQTIKFIGLARGALRMGKYAALAPVIGGMLLAAGSQHSAPQAIARSRLVAFDQYGHRSHRFLNASTSAKKSSSSRAAMLANMPTHRP